MRISYLVLSYNRPREARACVESIRRNSRFDYELIFLANGGEQSYALDLYKEGMVDRLILNRGNSGLGFGTTDLFRLCSSEYAIYVQDDQLMVNPLEQDLLSRLITALESDRSIGAIGLAGPCAGVDTYSERPHLINVSFYNSIPGKPNGGCGPHYDKDYNEGYIQQYFRRHGLHYPCGFPSIFEDNGDWSIRENPCGGVSRFRISTSQLWWDVQPKEKFLYPNLTDEEWAASIAGGWIGGNVPAHHVSRGDPGASP